MLALRYVYVLALVVWLGIFALLYKILGFVLCQKGTQK